MNNVSTTTPLLFSSEYQIRRTLFTDGNCTHIKRSDALGGGAPNPDSAFLTGECAIPPALQHMCDDRGVSNYNGTNPLKGPISGVCTYELGDPKGILCPSHFNCNCSGPGMETRLPVGVCSPAAQSTTTWVRFDPIVFNNEMMTTAEPSDSNASLVPAVVGGVAAGVICLLFGVLGVYLVVRRKRKQTYAAGGGSDDDFDHFDEEEIRQHEAEKAKKAKSVRGSAHRDPSSVPPSAPVVVPFAQTPLPESELRGNDERGRQSRTVCQREREGGDDDALDDSDSLSILSTGDGADTLPPPQPKQAVQREDEKERHRRHLERMERSRGAKVGVGIGAYDFNSL